jgi:SAM-dependent methyltransferase
MNKPEGTSRARRQYEGVVARIKKDVHRSATIGADLKTRDDWWSAGEHRFRVLTKKFPIAPHHRVIDYGCGSLRIGVHFIHYLNPGCYFGMDVTSDLLDLGRELAGEDLLRTKAARLAAIDELALDEGERFAADYIFSWLVAAHVHQDELDYYFGNLVRLTRKPGAVLFFNAKLTDGEAETQYSRKSYARPLETFVKGLAPLVFVEKHRDKPAKEDSKSAGFTSALLQFRR